MAFHHFGIVHFINVVARQNNHVFGVVPLYKGNVLIYGVGGAFKPLRPRFGLIGRKYMYAAVRTVEIPRFAVTDILVEYKRLILRKHAYGIYTGVYAI